MEKAFATQWNPTQKIEQDIMWEDVTNIVRLYIIIYSYATALVEYISSLTSVFSLPLKLFSVGTLLPCPTAPVRIKLLVMVNS